MKESYGEGVATHTGPESCAVGREAGGEALTGARASRVLSREIHEPLRGADALRNSGRPHRARRQRETRPDPARTCSIAASLILSVILLLEIGFRAETANSCCLQSATPRIPPRLAPGVLPCLRSLSAVDGRAASEYLPGMKSNTKSSITLAPEELKLVVALQAKLKAKSKVEVVRRGLRLLKESTDRESLRVAYRRASLATRATLDSELEKLDHLASEGLDES